MTFSQNSLISRFNGPRNHKIQTILVLKPDFGRMVFCLNRFIAQSNCVALKFSLFLCTICSGNDKDDQNNNNNMQAIKVNVLEQILG